MEMFKWMSSEEKPYEFIDVLVLWPNGEYGIANWDDEDGDWYDSKFDKFVDTQPRFWCYIEPPEGR